MRTRKRLLYVASTASHLRRFHLPYIRALSEVAEVRLMASGDPALTDYDLPFQKRMISLSNLLCVWRIRKILAREQFDAVLLNTSLAAFLVRAAMIGMRRRPYVHHIVHGYLFDEPLSCLRERILYRCERFLRSKTDAISVMNRADEAMARRHGLCRGEISFLRGMGVTPPASLPVPDPQLRARYARDGEMLCTFVGELSPRKNQRFLIEALGRLRARGLPVKLLLVGEGDERAALERLIFRLRLEADVFLIGNRDNVLAYLAITDVYVSASRREGLPFHILEAMACGLPILASHVKGQSDLLTDRPASLYPSGDSDAFCEALTHRLSDGGLGIGAVVYPNLADYRLEAVWKKNLEIMKKGWC